MFSLLKGHFILQDPRVLNYLRSYNELQLQFIINISSIYNIYNTFSACKIFYSDYCIHFHINSEKKKTTYSSSFFKFMVKKKFECSSLQSSYNPIKPFKAWGQRIWRAMSFYMNLYTTKLFLLIGHSYCVNKDCEICHSPRKSPPPLAGLGCCYAFTTYNGVPVIIDLRQTAKNKVISRRSDYWPHLWSVGCRPVPSKVCLAALIVWCALWLYSGVIWNGAFRC